MTVRVLIIDDSAFVRRAVRRMLATDPELEVVGEAADGQSGLNEVDRLEPDVVTLDLRMPGLDGIDTLEAMMVRRPTPVVLLSSYAQADATLTVRALAAGAVDFIDKSRVSAMEVYDLAAELVGKLKAAATCRTAPRPATADEQPTWLVPPSATRPAIIVIGASTGGPTALEIVLGALPATLAAAVLVIQHMPVGFTVPLMRRLAAVCALPVRVGGDDAPMWAGQVVVAPGGHEVVVTGHAGALRHRATAAAGRALPRLDTAFASAAGAVGSAACVVTLTGMGNDGVVGARVARDAGATVVVESASSCVVHGMPRAVLDAGLASCVAPIQAMGALLASLDRRAGGTA